MRASAVVNCQSIFDSFVFRSRSQAAISWAMSSFLSIRRSRHWPDKTLNSVSAMFSQLPCVGVSCSSSLSVSRLASAGGNAAYSDAGVWVLGVVLHQHDPLGVRVVDVQQVLDAVRPVDAGAPVADGDVAPAGKRLGH